MTWRAYQSTCQIKFGIIPQKITLVKFFGMPRFFLTIYEAPDIIITENKVQEVFTMKKTRTFITLILTAALLFLKTVLMLLHLSV